MKEEILFLGIALIIIGFILIFAYILYESFKAAKEKRVETKGGGVILIGPIPIIFGTDVESLKIVIILAIVLMIIAIIIFLYFGKIAKVF